MLEQSSQQSFRPSSGPSSRQHIDLFGEIVKSEKQILYYFSCVKDIAKKNKRSVSQILTVLDITKYPGIKYSFLKYENSKEFDVFRRDGSGKSIMYTLRKGEFKENKKETEKLYETAQLVVKNMNTSATGVRKGETIKGVCCTAKGSIITITEGNIPASGEDLSILRNFQDLWYVFLERLSSIPYFKNMTIKQRSLWFSLNEIDKNYDLSETEDVKGKVLDIGNSIFSTMEEEDLNNVLSSDGMLLSDMRTFFPRKPGSGARRHTLIFLPHFWKIELSFSIEKQGDGHVYDMSTGNFLLDPKGNILSFRDGYQFSLGAERSKKGTGRKEVNYFQVLLEKYNENDKNGQSYTQKDIDIILKKGCDGFTGAGYKSLLQKIIRYSPLKVRVLPNFPNEDENIDYDSDFVLNVVFTALLIHPGAFVPDIQRFVTGQESAMKRLAVSILEDSYLENYNSLLKLLVFAFLSQRFAGWKVSKKDFEMCMDTCSETLKDRRFFVYDFVHAEKVKPFKFSNENTDLENVSALLDELKSFNSDLLMTRDIAKMKGKYLYSKDEKQRPDIMEIYRCVDFHWCPEIGYYFPYDMVEKMGTPGTKPFHKLFRTLFGVVTGKNTRKDSKERTFPKSLKRKDFKKAVIDAQKLVYMARKKKDQKEKVDVVGDEIVECFLDISWISGMVGQINITGKPPVMVVMKPSDPLNLVAVKKPSRGMKDGNLDDEREAFSIKAAKTILTKGFALKACPPPVYTLKDVKLFLNTRGESAGEGDDVIEEFIFVGKDKKHRRWEELASHKEKVKVITSPGEKEEGASPGEKEEGASPGEKEEGVVFDASYLGSMYIEEPRNFLMAMLSYPSQLGMRLNSFKSLGYIAENTDERVLRRLKTYLTINKNTIEVARLSKDGGGVQQIAVMEDAGVLQFLLIISYLFPIALKRSRGNATKFEVTNFPVLWKVRDFIFSTEGARAKSTYKKWKSIKDVSGRNPKSYQTSVIEEMLVKQNIGKKGHFIYLGVGLGKTKIVLSFLQHLIKDNKVPKYIVYTTPKSALDSLFKEIGFFENLGLNLLIPLKSWKKNPRVELAKSHDTLLPFCVNVIEHDHLKYVEEELFSKIGEAIFIVDEVHKTLNDTKRTSTALELARLSIDFVVLTGTPTNDTNMYKLINWLELLNDFTITEKNFWVAANGMTSRILTTGVDVQREDILARFSKTELSKYFSLVPESLGGSKPVASASDISKAFGVCYQACTRKMIEICMELYEGGTGVMVVARNMEHQRSIQNELIAKGVKESEVFLIDKNHSVYLTDEDVESGKTKDYKFVITTKMLVEGYTLTRFNTMVTSVYPSAQSSREQLIGRINRINQRSKKVHIKTVHCGILSYVMERHADAASISAILESLAIKINK